MPTIETEEPTVTITVTRRQLTLIRVALLQRLERLKDKRGEHVKASYNESRDMMLNGGVLHDAAFPVNTTAFPPVVATTFDHRTGLAPNQTDALRDALRDAVVMIGNEIAYVQTGKHPGRSPMASCRGQWQSLNRDLRLQLELIEKKAEQVTA
jgi:hypothetical protein